MTPEEKVIVDDALGKLDTANGLIIEAQTLLEGLEVTDPCPKPEPPAELPEHPELAARTSGVAPLSVFFDSGAEGPDFLGERYLWDFNDPASGTWAHSGRSKATESGPVAGHVFETPGTFVVKLNDEKQVTIEVEDPSVVFPGAKTVCISQFGDFEEAPAGAALITTANWATVVTHIVQGNRVLFRRGEDWGITAGFTGTVAGPGILGAFGPGTMPHFRLMGNQTFLGPRMSDWRIVDLDIDGLGTSGSRGFRAGGTCSQVLILRCQARNVKNGFTFSTSQLESPSAPPQTLYDQCAIVECQAGPIIGGSGGYASMFAGTRGLFLGNNFSNAEAAEHILRCPLLEDAVIAHNDLGRPAVSKHVIKLHGPPFADSSQGVAHWPGRYTERFFVARNIIRGGLATWPVASGPEDNHTDQRVRDGLFEGNRVEAGSEMQVAFYLSAVGILARNNEVIGTGGKSTTAFWITRRGIEPMPGDIYILHNTAFTADPDRFTMVDVSSGVTGAEVRGNLGSAPASLQKAMIAGVAVGGDNLLTDSPGFVDVASGDLDILETSPAFAAAGAIPEVWDDKDGIERTTPATAIGANEG